MKNNNVMGVVFANVNDDLIRELTEVRSMASVPFGGRYRMIDFSLSNLVNAGVSKVGIIPKYNYHSLMDHVGSGKPWDLDRKSGGLSILPPYVNSEISIDTGRIDSLSSVMSYLSKSKENYIVLCDADVVGNIDISKMVDAHIESKADITFAYKNGPLPKSDANIMTFEMQDDGRIVKIRTPENYGVICDFSLDIIIMQRTLLIDLVKTAREENMSHRLRDVISSKIDTLKLVGYEVKEFTLVIDGTDSYANANFALLDPAVRAELFALERPIYTKNRDDVPTRYGLEAKVSNSLIADGCVIEGEVNDCVLFRGVKVEKGAKLSNCIIMQDSVVRSNANLRCVIADKNVEITEGRELSGAPTHYMTVRKSSKV